MIRFSVVWHRDALDQLATLWLDAADQPAVSRATNAIDADFASDAHTKGKPTIDGLRVLGVPPLRVLFEVSKPDRMVKILLVSS